MKKKGNQSDDTGSRGAGYRSKTRDQGSGKRATGGEHGGKRNTKRKTKVESDGSLYYGFRARECDDYAEGVTGDASGREQEREGEATREESNSARPEFVCSGLCWAELTLATGF